MANRTPKIQTQQLRHSLRSRPSPLLVENASHEVPEWEGPVAYAALAHFGLKASRIGEIMLDLTGKRILVTQASDFMGPAICRELQACGADVVADHRLPVAPQDSQLLIEAAGPLDALVINLALPAPSTPVVQISESEWEQVFATMVHPLPRLVRAVVPGMKARGGGKIIVMGSASALRGMKRAASYSAARGAQLAFVQAAGVELAADNIQLNAVAQNFVDNPTYFPADVQANPRFQERLKREVPLGRLVTAEEDAKFVAYLCSDAASCFVGQVFPMSGGWAVR